MRGMISRARGKQLIGKMRGRRIGVLGDWMLDRYVWGRAERISPEAAVPVVDFEEESSCLGGAGNVAANMSALGASVEGFGIVGHDEAAAEFRKRMREQKISGTGILEIARRKTTLKTRIIARHQQIVRIDREDKEPLSEKHRDALLARVLRSVPKLDALLISDYEKGVMTDFPTEQVLGACKRHDVPVFIKPKWSRKSYYPGASAVVINQKEAESLCRKDSEAAQVVTLDSDKAIEEAAESLLALFGSSAIVITRGKHGMSLLERSNPSVFHVAAVNREMRMGLGATATGRQVFDVTGAGDTVLAVFALAAAAGASLREAVLLGNAAAGVVVGKLGTATLTREELAGALWE